MSWAGLHAVSGNVWRFWTVPIRAEPLALFRILLGLMMLGNLLTGFAFQLPSAVGEDPLIPAVTRDEWLKNNSRPCLLRGRVGLPLLDNWLPEHVYGRSVLGVVNSFSCATGIPLQGWVSDEADARWKHWGEQASSAYLLFGLYLVAIVMMTAGLCTRVSTFAVLILGTTFTNFLSEYINGGDYLARNATWYLLLSPAGVTWSLDAWWRQRSQRAQGLPLETGPVLIEPWSVRLMQIQVCFMYLFVGLTKLADLHWDNGWLTGEWIDGTALYWVLNDIQITRWSYAQFPIPLLVCKLMTWVTLTFEIGFIVFVLWRWTRIPLLITGVLLHVGIFFIMEIGWFSQITLCWYVLFLSGDSVTAAVRWVLGLPGPTVET